MKIAGRLLLKNILLVSVLSSSDLIYKNTMFDAGAFTTRRALNEAVRRERDSWQEKLNKSQNEIKKLQSSLSNAQDKNKKLQNEKAASEKTAKNEKNSLQNKLNTSQEEIKKLQNNLNNAKNENKKLQNEKVASEKTAKDKLMQVINEKEDTVKELKTTKNNFKSTTDKLNKTITQLNKEKQKLKKDIRQGKKNLETTKREYEAKLKLEQKAAQDKLTEATNRLNSQISEKTAQLNKALDTLKQVTQEYSETRDAYSASDVKNLVEIEILKSQVITQKTELKTLLQIAKSQDETKTAIIKDLRQKLNTLNAEFNTVLESTKSAELKNLLYIEKLSEKINLLNNRNEALIKLGKERESKLIAKIKTLVKKQKAIRQEYTAMMIAYQIEEQKNLSLIDTLKFELNKAIKNNEMLINVAKRMKTEKEKEDFADSQSEAKQLLQIDVLNDELRDAIQKNAALLQNSKNIKNRTDNLIKNLANESDTSIRDLQAKLESSNREFAKLKNQYNNREVWIKEIGALKGKAFENIFEGTIFDNSRNPSNQKISLENWLSNKKPEPALSNLNGNDQIAGLNVPQNEYQNVQNAGQWTVTPGGEKNYNNVPLVDAGNTSLNGNTGQVASSTGQLVPSQDLNYNIPSSNTGQQYADTSAKNTIQTSTAQENNLNSNGQIAGLNVPQNEYQNVQNAGQWTVTSGIEKNYNNAQLVNSGNTPLNSNTGQLVPSQDLNYNIPSSNIGHQYADTSAKNTIQTSVAQEPKSTSDPRYINAGTLPGSNQQYSNIETAQNINQQPVQQLVNNRAFENNVSSQTIKNTSDNVKTGGNEDVIKTLEDRGIEKTPANKTVDLAIDATINAIKKMTNNDERKTNASVSLIGAGHELPEKLDAVVSTIKEKFKPEVLDKALKELSNRQTQRQNFVDESLRHMYGKDGDKVVTW